jgi:thioredoxin 1
LRRILVLCVLIYAVVLPVAATPFPQAAVSTSFAPVESWRLAVLSGDSAKLSELYSRSPEPMISDLQKNPITLQQELSFWSSWKAKGLSNLKVEIIEEQTPQPGTHLAVFRASLALQEGAAIKHQYLVVVQGWSEQESKWLLGFAQRSDTAQLRQPIEKKDLYPASADARKEIAEALTIAAKTHQRVLLVFGANWCYDCHVLDEAFHSPEIAPTMGKSFEVVHVDIGQSDKNLDIAKQYDVPLDRGVPAIAVLDSDGKLLFSQKRGEFEAARSMSAEDILDFLDKWKPTPANTH